MEIARRNAGDVCSRPRAACDRPFDRVTTAGDPHTGNQRPGHGRYVTNSTLIAHSGDSALWLQLPSMPLDGCLHCGDEPTGGFERVGNLFPGDVDKIAVVGVSICCETIFCRDSSSVIGVPQASAAVCQRPQRRFPCESEQPGRRHATIPRSFECKALATCRA